MKRNFASRCAAVLALALLAACQDNPAAGPEPAPIDPDLVRQVEALGFRGDMIEDFGDYVLVEGDIHLPKSRLRGVPAAKEGEMTPRFQFSTNALVGAANVTSIRVNMTAVSADWQTATRQAMASWSAIQGANIRFVEVTSGTADIVVSAECRGDGVIAWAGFPGGGLPGAVVVYNDCWVINGVPTTPTAGQRRYNAVHELGHTLGFRHSNWNSVDCWPVSCGGNPGPNGANLVAGTPTSDGASVMNGMTATNSWNGFSANDLLAARTLYPIPTPTATLAYVSGQPRLTWTALPGATSYTVHRNTYMTGYDEFGPFQAFGFQGTFTGVASPWTDTVWSYTGTDNCYTDLGSSYWMSTGYYYTLEAIFPNGTTSTIVLAETAVC